MNVPALRALPVAKLAAPDSVLALWVFGPCLSNALALIADWGFVYKSIGLVWVKTQAGDGAFRHWLLHPQASEILLLATADGALGAIIGLFVM
jgi:N6-adenosine-specific RNA methylase IME4